MYTVQVKEQVQGFVRIFHRMGIWQSDEESTLRKTGKKIFYAFFSALFPVFFGLNAFLCDDRDESMSSVQLAIQGPVVYVKCLYLLFKKREILAFLYDSIVIQPSENDEDHERTDKKIKRFVKFVRSYSWTISVSCILIISINLPMFSADKTLPMFVSLSWNDSEMVYWLSFLFLSLSMPLYVVINLTTILIWYIMLKYSVEYQQLGSNLRNLGKKTINQNVKNQEHVKKAGLAPRRTFVKDLIAWIKVHRKLSETIERFKYCLSPLFLGQITTSGIGICIAVYNLAFTSRHNIVQTELYTSMLLYILFDIFMVMYLANEITAASDRLFYCLFESNWIDQTESCKKYVLIMAEVLKQPHQLIVNGGYSMLNILKSFQ